MIVLIKINRGLSFIYHKIHEFQNKIGLMTYDKIVKEKLDLDVKFISEVERLRNCEINSLDL